MFRHAAELVDRILRCVKPADLPVEQPSKFELVVNLTTAKALGFGVARALLARADEVIDDESFATVQMSAIGPSRTGRPLRPMSESRSHADALARSWKISSRCTVTCERGRDGDRQHPYEDLADGQF
jgi:hypothetical protein